MTDDPRPRRAHRAPAARRSVLAASIAVAACASGGALAAAQPAPPAQPLVTLLAAQRVRSGPETTAALVAVIAARRPITGVRTVLPVLARARGGWLRVPVPGRPNGRSGWIGSAGTRAGSTAWSLAVRLGRRRVLALRGGIVVRSFLAVVGKPSTPTPTGTFFVEEPVRLSAADVGAPYALALSARSDVLQEFDGGPGQIALHGLAHVGGRLGTAASHGCIRLDAGAMRWLAGRIGAGVVVTVTR